MPVSEFKDTTYDINQNVFPLAESFPRGFEGFLFRLTLKTARSTQNF